MAKVKLKKAVKKKWVEALRSGKYKQGQSSLAENGKYCCLGVLCEVAVENGLPLEVKERKDAGRRWKSYDHDTAFLPQAVAEWATKKPGRPFRVYDFGVPGGDSLIGLNDSGKSFAEIADVIEKEL